MRKVITITMMKSLFLLLFVYGNAHAESACNPIDLVIALDSSYSVGSSDWEQEKDLIKNLTASLDVESGDDAVAFVNYGQTAQIVNYFGDIRMQTHASINAIVDGLAAIYWGTAISDALAKAFDIFSAKSPRAANNIIIFLTDGYENVEINETVRHHNADLLKAEATAVVIGVGNRVRPSELLYFADPELLFYVPDFSALRSIYDILSETICVHEDFTTTSDPTTADPTNTKPTTGEPTTSDPTTSDPTTSDPTTSEPTSAEPTTGEPTTAAPTTGDPTTSEPTTTSAAPIINCFNNMHEWRVEPIGSSSQFRFYDMCNGTQFVKVKMDTLIEYDVDNKATTNRINSFASQEYEWDTEGNIVYQDNDGNELEAMKNKYIATLSVGTGKSKVDVDFALETLVFFGDNNDNDLNNNAIYSNTLKWSVDIENWPFIDMSNTLRLCINIMIDGDTMIDVDDFSLRTPIIATYDGQDIDNVIITEDDQKRNSKHQYFCYQFNSFQNQLYYDPFIDFIDNINQNNHNNVDMVSTKQGVQYTNDVDEELEEEEEEEEQDIDNDDIEIEFADQTENENVNDRGVGIVIGVIVSCLILLAVIFGGCYYRQYKIRQLHKQMNGTIKENASEETTEAVQETIF